MDAGMYSHPATQENIKILKKRGVHFIGPKEGHLASGLVGPGRMSEPPEIIGFSRWLLSRKNPLTGKKVLITAGGTREAIDPVRYISNHSSGKQGYALAQAALDFGAEVTLISTPSHQTVPFGSHFIQVQSAEEMYNAVMAEIGTTNALIMSAAVADFQPEEFRKEKIKKEKGLTEIKLTRTRDIIAETAKLKKSKNLNLKIIGFAAESENLKNNAKKKMTEKEMDMIVANDITDPQAGFSVDTNKVLLIFSDGSTEQLPLLQKSEVAEKVIQHLASWLIEGAG
jgi:phosphopantothenoylcysteine decarboxylase/phosphopantothenate--cysteine ligase